MACGMVPAHWMLDATERAMVEHMGAMAHHPLQLEVFIAETHAAFPDDDFPAARLDPEARRGWPPAVSGAEARIERHPPWSEPTNDLTADLRAGTQHLIGEALHARINDNIRALPASFAVPNSGADPRRHDMMPVTVAAFYLYCLEQRIRELEGRMPHAKP
jgi:hypothetical protein